MLPPAPFLPAPFLSALRLDRRAAWSALSVLPCLPALSALAGTGGVSLDVPVTPGADEARRQAAEELSQRVYRDARPGVAELVWDWIVRAIGSFVDGLKTLGGNTGLLVTMGLVLVLVVAAVLVLRPRLVRRAAVPARLFGADPVRTADEHRESARLAADRGDFATAVTEMFRALVRAAEERAGLAPAPGQTAEEAGAALARSFPDFAPAIGGCATLFGAVRYGRLQPSEEDYRGVAETAAALESARAATEDSNGAGDPPGGGGDPHGLLPALPPDRP